MPEQATEGSLLDYGRTAEVFTWGDGRVLKLFREDWPVSVAQEEARISRAVHDTGLPVPGVEGVIKVEGRHGIIYERFDGPTMGQQILEKPWTLGRLARVLAQLHAAMHEHTVPELPSQRQKLVRSIQSASPLPAEMKKAALDALAEMPDVAVLCHGDFHPGNVIMSSRGPVIIDWIDATRGNPVGDVARTSLLLRSGALPVGGITKWLVELGRRHFHSNYLKTYLQRRPVSQERIDAWRLPIAAARLAEDIREEQTQLLTLVAALIR